MALTDKLKNIGNAIRAKTGGTELLTLDEMATAIEGIESGGGASTKMSLKKYTHECYYLSLNTNRKANTLTVEIGE